MKRFSQNNFLIFPHHRIVTYSEADLSFAGKVIDDFEE